MVERRELVIQAFAKMNLWLRVGERRNDGYHEIHTCMGLLGVADEVRIEWEEGLGVGGVEFRCEPNGFDTGPDEENLAYRAAEVFLRRLELKNGERRGCAKVGLKINLVKRIPSQAGLGGGSSDAAAVLRGLQELARYPLGAEEVRQLAAELGSDVPFFLLQRGAICLGRGEEVIPVELPWRGWVLLVKPPFGVATGWAYGRLAERRREGAEWAASWEEGMLKELEWGKWLWRNDLEDAVFEKFLILRDLKEWLSGRAGVEAVMLAGSGSTVAAFSREKGALFTIVEELEREFGRVWGPAAGGMACLDGEMGFWVAVTELFG